MVVEASALFALSMLLLFAWMPWSMAKSKAFGMEWLQGNREVLKDRQVPEWGNRAERAYRNLQDYYPVFLGFIALLLFLEVSSPVTVYASTGFVLTRYLHFISYVAGWPKPRILAWTASMICLLALAFAVLCSLGCS